MKRRSSSGAAGCFGGVALTQTTTTSPGERRVSGASRKWNFPEKSQRCLQRVFQPGLLLDRAKFHPIPVA